jgi:glucose-6-phosphate isomerase
MGGMFMDERAREAMLEKEDTLLYEVYEVKVPDEAGHLLVCTSITYPGRVGKEYFMTKGHFHETIDTAEVYNCLGGEGMMLMESDRGEWKTESMTQGRVVYVPPFYAHRSINTGQAPLISFCVYPGGAGHDYATIETKGFRKLVLEKNGNPEIEDNPKWKTRT